MRLCAILIPVLLAACQTSRSEPDHITVDHILIGVKTAKLPDATRDVAQARQLAYKLLDQIEHGGDWAALKKLYSDDPPPGGPYRMANNGSEPRDEGEHARGKMVKGFGDVSFSLKVGEIKMADYDVKTSPYGFHIIKRVR